MLEKRTKEDALYRAIWPNGAPKRNIACAHCAQINRLDTGKATLFMDKCRCGSCGTFMFLGTQKPMGPKGSGALRAHWFLRANG